MKIKRKRAKFLISTKAELLTDKLNDYISECEEKGYEIKSISPFMSYTDINNKGAYMIGCMVQYTFDEYTEV